MYGSKQRAQWNGLSLTYKIAEKGNYCIVCAAEIVQMSVMTNIVIGWIPLSHSSRRSSWKFLGLHLYYTFAVVFKGI